MVLAAGLTLIALALGVIGCEAFLGLAHDNWEPIRIATVLALPRPGPDETLRLLWDMPVWTLLWLAGTVLVVTSQFIRPKKSGRAR